MQLILLYIRKKLVPLNQKGKKKYLCMVTELPLKNYKYFVVPSPENL